MLTGNGRLRVVRSTEGHYSVWPCDRDIPAGWSAVGPEGSEDECLAEVERLWIDMRPTCVREGRATGSIWGAPPVAAPEGVLVGPTRALPDEPIQTLIARALERGGDRPALRDETQILSSAELLSRIRRWAAVLRDRGVGPETVVAILLPRGVTAVSAMLAVLEADGAYLVLPYSDPPNRVAALLADAGEPLLITDSSWHGRLRRPGSATISVSRLADEALDASETPVPPLVGLENLAYVIYTSGSTGLPKGVMNTHRQLVNYVLWCVEAFDCRPDERVALHQSLAFAGCITTLFPPLFANWELQLAPEGIQLDQLAAHYAETETTLGLIKFTPSHVRLLASSDPAPARQVMVASELFVSTERVASWMAANPDTWFANHYGLTETCGGTCDRVRGVVPTVGEPIPVGRPILNAQVLVLDDEGHPVPPGTSGRLCLAGAVVGRGYLGRPGWTARRWLPNPWGIPGSRLLDTGDVGRVDEDGRVRVLGRADRQVKIRGHRVELREVEEALRSQPGVADAVSVAASRQNGATALVAYVQPVSGATVDPLWLRSRLADELPDAAVPSRIVAVDHFPLNANGKVDTHSMAEREGLSIAETPDDEDDDLKQITAAAAFVLHVDAVRPQDNFFSLGGNSLAAVELALALEERMDVSVSAADILQSESFAALASVLRVQASSVSVTVEVATHRKDSCDD